MGLWIGLGLLVLASGPVALVVVLRLAGEVRALRRAVEARAAGGPVAPAPPRPATVVAGAPAPADVRAGVVALPRPRRDLESAFGGAWLTWLGVLALFFGTAFFLATDLRGSTVAGTGQVLVGVLVGALFLVAGRFAARRAQRFLGLGFLGGGIALLDLAAYAAYAFHHLVAGAVVFPFLFAVAVLGALLAMREDSRTIATLTLVGALSTPLFLRMESDPAPALFAYLVVVNLGAGLVATRRAWHALSLVAFAGTVLVVGLWWGRNFDRDARATACVGTTALWFLFAWQGLFAGRTPRPLGALGIAQAVVTLANGLAYATALHRLLGPDLVALRGLAIGLLALVYVGGGRVGLYAGARRDAALVTEYAGIVLAAVAVPVQFDLAWIGLGWAALALVLLQAGVTLPSFAHRALGLALLGAAAVRIVFFDTQTALRGTAALRPVVNGEFAVGVCVAGAAAAAAWLLHRRRHALGRHEAAWIDVLAVVGAALLLWRLSVEVLAVFAALDAARATSTSGRAALLTLSLVWAAYAGIAIAIGLWARYRPLRAFGIVVLGLLVLKVFVFDLQALERGYRIASFVGVGLLLLAISVLYQRERRT
jgi:uncharacterized membrane protein